MRASILAVLIGLTLGAVACTTVGPIPVSTANMSAPAPIDKHDWFFGFEGSQAGLAYGLEESDDVWFGLSCRRASGRLDLSRPVENGHLPTLSVGSGGETASYPATSEPSEIHEGVFLIAGASTRDPVFQQFRQTGWMTVSEPGERHAMVPQPASRPNIERFFAFCG